MRPVSFSATALQTAEGCLSRYHAEVIEKGRGPGGFAATVGLICHDTLEHFLRGTQIKRDVPWSRTELDRIFNEAYERTVGPDRTKPEYVDAYTLILKWFNSPGREEYFRTAKVLSLESKNNFNIPVVILNERNVEEKIEIPVNYIMDRVDQLGDDEYKVVDYKTNWVPLTHDELRQKIQARLYALAMQIIYPKARRIWVEFDFLRHEAVEIGLSKEDQAETWRMLKRAAQRIIDTSDDDARKSETINPECVWCVKKGTCKALNRNLAVGGTHTMSTEDKARRFLQIKSQVKALEALQGELEGGLLMELIKAQTTDLSEGGVRIRLKRSSRRTFDSHAVAGIIGPQLMGEVGSVTLKVIDDLRKSGKLSRDQIEKIDALTTVKMGDPGVDVSLNK